MSLLRPEANAIWLNALLFAAAACAIWYAGTKLERFADAIATRTKLGQAFVGMVLLAAATSLPELATTLTAVWIGNVSLAVHNLLGSVVFNTLVLVFVDAVVDRRALSHRSPRFSLLIQGLGVILLLAIVLMGASVGRALEKPISVPLWLVDIGLWEGLLLFAYGGVLYLTYQAQSNPRWTPVRPDRAASKGDDHNGNGAHPEWSAAKVYGGFALASLVVLAAGWTLTQTGDAMATQTGLGSSFVGFTLLALATSLPEVTTTLAAARAGNDEMAFSNVFGSSAFVVMLLAVVGLSVGNQTIIQSATPSASFAAALGILVTGVYLWGLLEQKDRTVLRLGWDSVAVLVLAAGGIGVMYVLK